MKKSSQTHHLFAAEPKIKIYEHICSVLANIKKIINNKTKQPHRHLQPLLVGIRKYSSNSWEGLFREEFRSPAHNEELEFRQA